MRPWLKRRLGPQAEELEEADAGVGEGQLLAHARIVGTAELASQVDELVDPGAGPTAADHRAFAGQGGLGHAPAAVDLAHDVGRGDGDVGEEHLVEVGMAGDLPERPDLDARGGHVHDEVGDPGVLGDVGVGAGQQDAELGLVGAGVPDLLAVDDPGVTVALGPGAQAGQVGAGAGLAVELAPQLIAAQDGIEVLLLLLGGAVGDEGRADHVHRDRQHAGRHVELALLLGEDAGLVRRAAPPPVRLGPRDARPAAVIQRALPATAGLEVARIVGRGHRRSGIGLATLGVGLEPRPGFGTEGRLVRGVVEVHDRQH